MAHLNSYIRTARGKLAVVGYLGVHIGYGTSSPTYRVWNSETKRVYHVAATAFDESAAPEWLRISNAGDEEPVEFPLFPVQPADASPAVPEVAVATEADSVQGTSGEGLVHERRGSTQLWGHCDASFLTCPDTRRCRWAYVFISAGEAFS